LTYSGLAIAIVAIYSSIVVGPVLVVGRWDGGGPGLILPIVASGVVAALFEPIRSRLERAANRLVFGDRASPYEVLSQVTSSLPAVAAADGTAALAQLLARGTGAARAIVWLASGETLQPSGVSPHTAGDDIAPVEVDGLADDENTETQPVLHRGEIFGSLTIIKHRNDPVTPADRRLLADVAAGSGLLLRNVRLNSELEQRAADVRDSRRRLIAAQDAERLRLERDLHDGAQQQVVALKVKLGIVRAIAQREGADEIVTQVTSLADETQKAVDALRAVAHGIYPPLLESDGLEPALRAVERMPQIAVTVSADGLRRFGRTAEEAAYFCVRETVERARVAAASAVSAVVVAAGDDLVVRLDIEGCDTALDLTSIADRIDAAGGTFGVEERTGGQTLITSTVPVSETVPA
jgi:signal transduction histidine kinase